MSARHNRLVQARVSDWGKATSNTPSQNNSKIRQLIRRMELPPSSPDHVALFADVYLGPAEPGVVAKQRMPLKIRSIETRLLNDSKTFSLHFTADTSHPVFFFHGFKGIFSPIDVMLASHRQSTTTPLQVVRRVTKISEPYENGSRVRSCDRVAAAKIRPPSEQGLDLLAELLWDDPDFFTSYVTSTASKNTGSAQKMIMIKQMAQVNGISELTELVVLEDLNVLFAAVGVVGEVAHELPDPPPLPEPPVAKAVTAFTIFIQWEQAHSTSSFDTMCDRVRIEWKPTAENVWEYRVMPGTSSGRLCLADLHAATEYQVAVSLHNSYGWSERSPFLIVTTEPF